MSKLVLLIVGAMWMAVLLPPLLRSRFDPGASSSVSDFRRQLNTLQRTQAPVGAPKITRLERDMCINFVRSLNSPVAAKLQEIRGNL